MKYCGRSQRGWKLVKKKGTYEPGNLVTYSSTSIASHILCSVGSKFSMIAEMAGGWKSFTTSMMQLTSSGPIDSPTNLTQSTSSYAPFARAIEDDAEDIVYISNFTQTTEKLTRRQPGHFTEELCHFSRYQDRFMRQFGIIPH